MGYKIGDRVIPKIGPHKDHPHEVIHVWDDGVAYNIKPIGLKASQIKYRLGATKATPDQLLEEDRLLKTSVPIPDKKNIRMFSKLKKKAEELYKKYTQTGKKPGIFGIERDLQKFKDPEELNQISTWYQEWGKALKSATTYDDLWDTLSLVPQRLRKEFETTLGNISEDNTNQTIQEMEGKNNEDIIAMDVPLFIRLLEYAREDAKSDMDLHKVAERTINISQETEGLNIIDMSMYDELVGTHESDQEDKSLNRMLELAGVPISEENQSPTQKLLSFINSDDKEGFKEYFNQVKNNKELIQSDEFKSAFKKPYFKIWIKDSIK